MRCQGVEIDETHGLVVSACSGLPEIRGIPCFDTKMAPTHVGARVSLAYLGLCASVL